MRREIYYELSRDETIHRVEFKPIPKTPKYQIFIDNSLKYMGAGFRLDECMERLSFFERNGFSIRILAKKSKLVRA